MPAPAVHQLEAFNMIWLTGEENDGVLQGRRYPINPKTYVDCFMDPTEGWRNPLAGKPTTVKVSWTFNNAPGSQGNYFYFLVYTVVTPSGAKPTAGACPLPASLGAGGNFTFSLKVWQGAPLTITFWYVGLWLNVKWFCLDSLPLDASLTPAATYPSAPNSIATPASAGFTQQTLN